MERRRGGGESGSQQTERERKGAREGVIKNVG